MEQPAVLHILRTENAFRFRLDLPDGPTGQEYSTELTAEIRERLRRLLQSATQFMQSVAWAEMKRQTIKLGAVNDTLLTLGRFLFETLLPVPLQETVRRIDTSLMLVENTAEIPWELMFDANAKPGRYLCQ